ncbi:unnamed protein product [marine sediment metagenome]|uniref:Uncharacterized protein n=1 Tax=marine sediment metagenome TaxID=412755 RepID=X0XGV5_9ZZZZ
MENEKRSGPIKTITIIEVPYKITKEYFEAQNNGKIRWEKLLRPNPSKDEECKECNHKVSNDFDSCNKCSDYDQFEEIDLNPFDYSTSEVYDIEDDSEPYKD